MLKNIGILGDSIAHGYYDERDLGWPARLGKLMLSQNENTYVFNNMAQSGDNIADTANRAVYEVLSRHFDLLLLNIGINDLRRRKNSQLQLDFSEGARIMYWNRLLDTLAQANSKIVIMDLTPVIENRYTPDASLVRYNADVERYNKIIEGMCKERNIHFFARYDMWKDRNLDVLYKDATHPNARGHQLMAEEIYTYLKDHNLL